jgi:hypothetical protein
MNNDTVTITWQAFGKPTSATIQWECDPYDDDLTLEDAFRATNMYEGAMWDVLQPHLPADRTHTALSVGDTVKVGDTTYICEPIGWYPI